MTLDVEYEAYPAPGGGVDLWATVTVRGGKSISGRLAAAATEALLRGGALTLALNRIAAEIDRRADELNRVADRHTRQPTTQLRRGLVTA
jgi:hypothetical protein